MRQNYFEKLVCYMKNVYHIERGLNKLSDGRVNPTYTTGQVILPVLFGFLLRINSFNGFLKTEQLTDIMWLL